MPRQRDDGGPPPIIAVRVGSLPSAVPATGTTRELMQTIRHRLRRTQTARWGLLAPVPAIVAVVRKRRNIGLPRGISAALVTAVPLLVAAALPRSRRRHALLWALHMWAYKVMYEIPYDRPERLGNRVKVDYALRSDALIGLGIAPAERLQSRLRSPPKLVALDYVLTALYLTWEIEPHLAVAWILCKHEDAFPVAAARLGATYDATLLGYWLVPTAPPWWASEKAGRMRGNVHRVVPEVLRELRNKPRPAADHEQGANPWAAMPSDHFASALMTAMILHDVSPRAGALGYTYALALGFALVYLGEHYVTDLLAGSLLAVAIQTAEPHARPAGTRLACVWRRNRSLLRNSYQQTVAFRLLESGGGGIRTRGPLARTPVFKTGAFVHSATPPSEGIVKQRLAQRTRAR
jgi:membrane-associated phospholipid phosphatase